MSEMHSVTILNRGKNWADLLLRQVHPDAGPFCAGEAYALALLLNEAYDFDESYNRRPSSPLGEQFAFDESYDPNKLANRARQFVKSVQVYKAVNLPFDERASHAAVDKRVLARGIARASDEWQEAWDDEWREWWLRPDGPPRAWYRIAVTDPRWVQHLEPGKSFDTSASSAQGPWVETNVDSPIKRPADALVAEDRVDFPLSHVPRRKRDMDLALVRSLAISGEPLAGEALERALADHRMFLDSGGTGGSGICSRSPVCPCASMRARPAARARSSSFATRRSHRILH